MKISVIIPCWNVEALLPATLDSVLAQEHQNLEIICVDDGSTDGTPAVLERFVQQSGGRMQVLRQPNQGACAARNAGMALATGGWLQFLDADDVLDPKKLSGQVELLRGASASTVLIVGDYEKIMPNGLLLPTEALYDRPWMALIRTRMGTTSANLWRKDAVERVGGWRTDLASSQDYELMFRLLKEGGTVLWDKRIATHVLKRVAGSISQTGVQDNWRRYIALRRAMKDHLKATDASRFRPEIMALDQYLFMAIRILAMYDLKEAVREFKGAISRGFRPEVSKAITEKYVFLFNLFGFANAERLVRWRKGQAA
ncbi:MAG: glycosyltransferase family 2 protein [Flavobacteriales bacterium]|nr:MAG: glycosyltransferase family 2 protein [Flavobacteriales bacterium]